LKYWPSSRDFNKLVIKAKMHANTYFLKFLCYMKIQYDFFLFFERLGRMYENKIFFIFFIFLMSWWKSSILILDLYLYNIKIKTNIDKKWIKKFAGNHIFFEIFFSDWAQPGPCGWAGPSKPGRVTFLSSL